MTEISMLPEMVAPTFELTSGLDRVELTKEQIGALMSPLNPNRVAHRNQGGKQLSYVEAWEIKAALIRVFGFGGFSSEVLESKIIDIRDDGRQGVYASGDKQGQAKTPYVMAYAKVQLTIHGIGPGGRDAVFTEAAIGSNDGYIISDVADNALKTAASDALKRCAINLGNQFGLGLYNNGSLADPVRVLLNPEQAAMLEAYRQENQPQPPNAQAAAQFAASLGAQVITNPQQAAEVAEQLRAESVDADESADSTSVQEETAGMPSAQEGS